MDANLIILGSGTSMGVPTLGCSCRVCTSPDPRDLRLRPSVAVLWEDRVVIIDTGPDFRAQVMNNRLDHVDAVLYTHSHADHIFGLDDLRPLSYKNADKVPLYADDQTAEVLESIFAYNLSETSTYKLRTRVKLHRLNGSDSVDLFGVPFRRIPLQHGLMQTGGYRFGNTAYLTDMNAIPEESLPLLEGVDLVIMDALRLTHHPAHANIEEATGWIEKLSNPQALFTHFSHEILHAEVEATLPANIRLAYDGLRLPITL